MLAWMSSYVRIGYIDGRRLRRSLLAACEYAQGQRSELNRINVFPVPDGDTGTNLALTVRAISDHLRGNRDRGVAAVARGAAQAAILGARGNCGMMLSHFLLGFAEHLGDRVRVGAEEFASAMKGGVRTLHDALDDPVEGTILTVMRDSAEAAREAVSQDFVALLDHVVARARDSLERTPDLLPVLRKAGVVDAGAKGFVSLLEGVLLFLHGDPLLPAAPTEERVAVAEVSYSEGSERYRYCTEALVRGDELPTQVEVRERLGSVGDSLIVIRSQDILKLHIHTDEPEWVFDYLRDLGELATHKAEDMRAQHATVGRAADAHVTLARRPVTLVTDSAADLPAEVVQAHGIHVVPLMLVTKDEEYRDGVDITAEEFHARLAGDESELPTTSQPSPAAFLEAFERAAEDGEQVLAVILGSSLSGTFGSAEAAARRFDGVPVHLMDTLGVSLLEGLLVLKACELAELAWAPEDIVPELDRIRAQSGALFTVETFDRLRASGRVSFGRALLASVLGLKPILAISAAGKIEPVARVLGSKRVITAMIEEVAKRVPERASAVRFGIVHVGAASIVQPVTEALRRRYGPSVDILITPATPVIATHLGVGAWGVIYLVEE